MYLTVADEYGVPPTSHPSNSIAYYRHVSRINVASIKLLVQVACRKWSCVKFSRLRKQSPLRYSMVERKEKHSTSTQNPKRAGMEDRKTKVLQVENQGKSMRHIRWSVGRSAGPSLS